MASIGFRHLPGLDVPCVSSRCGAAREVRLAERPCLRSSTRVVAVRDGFYAWHKTRSEGATLGKVVAYLFTPLLGDLAMGGMRGILIVRNPSEQRIANR